MAEAPGLGKIQFDPSISPAEQAEITRRLGVTGNIGTDYMQQQRRGPEQQAGDELLSRFGLDAGGNPVAAPEQQPGATPPSNAIQHAASAGERIRKIRQDQKNEPQPSFLNDVVGGTVQEVGRAAVGGVRDAVKEMLESADSLATFFADKTGFQKGGAFGKAAEAVPQITENAETPGGKLLQGIAQFAAGYATGGKALKAAGVAGKVAKPLLAGAFADLAAFDPNDPTISNLINETVPALKNPLTEFLATDPKDGEALNRFKRTVEGLGLGVATEAVIGVARGWRANRALAKAEQAFTEAKAKPAIEEPKAQLEAPVETTTAPPPSPASQIEVIDPRPTGVDIPVGTTGQGGIMQAERLALPAPESKSAARPSPQSQIDVVRAPSGQDVPLGTTGNAGVMQGERKLLPPPAEEAVAQMEAKVAEDLEAGRPLFGSAAGRAKTVGELADAIEKEMVAAESFRKSPEAAKLLKQQLNRQDLYNRIRGNPTLQAAYETALKGQSEEQATNLLISKERSTLEEIVKGQGGEISQDAVYTLARSAVGGALGLTQGDTTEERITNAVIGAGIGAALKPSLLKKLVGAMERVAPREMKIAKSFDPPTLDVTGKGMTRRPPKEIGPITVASEQQAKEFLAADPTAIQVGKKAIKINWSEIGSPEQIDDTIKTLTKLNEESIDVARRGAQSTDKTRALANMLGITEDDMLRRRRGQALNAEQTQAFIDVYGSATKELDRLATALKGGEQVENQFRMQLGRTTALTETVFGARAEAGRALRIWGQAGQAIKRIGGVQQQLDMLRLSGKGIEEVPADRLADMILALDTPAQKATFLQQATKLGGSAIMEAWMNGLLSNPVTHASNLVSNSATLFAGIAERAIAGSFGKEVARGEATAMMKGVIGGWREALDLAKRSFLAGESQLGFSKLEGQTRAITAENLGVSGQLGRAVDMLGAVVSTPGRALMAADDFFKGLNYRAELNAQAWRQANREGLSGGALKTRAADLAHDADFISLVKDQAENFAFYQTFNQELGRLGEGYISFLQDHPWARVVTPFVRTPVNIAKYTLERTPLVNLAMNQVRADLAAGGAKRDLALAKMATGSMFFGTAATLAIGGYITGGGPSDKDLRDTKRLTGWQPYSFKFGDTYVSYSRLDPLGFLFGLGADIVEKGGELQDNDLNGLAMAGMTALHDTFINKTYVSGLMHIMDALESPNRFTTNYFQNLAGSIVPAGVANLTRQLDPTIKEVNSAGDAIFSRLPGFGGPVRRNIWGEPIQLEGALGPDMVSPFYTSTKKDDPAADEILRLDMSVGMPQKYIYGTRPGNTPFAAPNPGEGIKLLPEEYSRYAELAGNELKLGGKGLHEKILETIESPAYQSKSDLAKKTMLQQLFNVYREAAQQKLIQEFPDLKEAIADKIQERASAMQGQ